MVVSQSGRWISSSHAVRTLTVATLAPINATDDEWLTEAIHVFDGQFSCCRFGTSVKCDREYLVLSKPAASAVCLQAAPKQAHRPLYATQGCV